MTDPTPAIIPTAAPVEPAPPVPPVTPAPEPAKPAAEPPKLKTDWTAEEAAAEIARLRDEAKSWRLKLREVEPIVEAHNAAEEAAKTEVQRATDRAAAVEKEKNALIREVVAARYGVPDEDLDFLGSGTREEMEAKGERYAARFAATSIPTPPPPSNRPVESLRPGASPTPPAPVDTSYPAAWKP